MSEFIQINTTSDKKETLQSIAARLVEQRLAACVQIGGPIESVYSWKGQNESTQEWTCSIKSIRQNSNDIEKTIFELHHYEQPEIIILPIVGGSHGYLDWVEKQTTRNRSE